MFFMSVYQEIPLDKAYLLLNHGPTIMVSSAYGDTQNVMTAAWSTPVDFSPPKILVVIDKNAYTRELIAASGEFTVSVPTKAIAKQAWQAGSSSGREINKFEVYGIEKLPAKKVSAPLIQGCLGCLECRLVPDPHTQILYDMVIGEVVAAWADPRVFSNGRWHIEQDELRSIHYQAGGEFFSIGQPFSVDL